MNNPERKTLEQLVIDIKAMHGEFEKMIERLKPVVDDHPQQGKPDEASCEYWKAKFFYDAMIRVRLFIEQNFTYIETLGLLAVTRYIFELLIWMKALAKDVRYGHVYRAQLMDKQLKYWVDYRVHVVREIQLLRSLQAEEERLATAYREKVGSYADPLKAAAAEVDRIAARRFCLYAEQAKRNGYGVQAHLVETKVLPELAQNADEVKTKLVDAKARVPEELRSIASDWKWKSEAVRVGMKAEYEFIYTFCSRLLHATPPSVSTDLKNLETGEMCVFLKFILASMRDMLDLSAGLCEPHSLH